VRAPTGAAPPASQRVAELPDLLPEFRLSEVRQFQSDHDPGRRAEPSTRRRARDPEIGGDGQVPGASDEIPEPVIVALLRAGRGRHPDDGRPIADTAQLLQDDAGRRSVRRELAHENTKCRWRQLGWTASSPRGIVCRPATPAEMRPNRTEIWRRRHRHRARD
jgi:hypothetical protein